MVSPFFSYSHKDEDLRDQLEEQLYILQRQQVIPTWHDRRILAGFELDPSIEGADIILLLVSPPFLASNYGYEREMPRALEHHRAGQARVIPVILRPCNWQDTPLGKLLATPKDGLAVTRWADRDEAFLDVTRSIKAAAKAMGAAPVSAQAVARPAQPVPAGAPGVVPGA